MRRPLIAALLALALVGDVGAAGDARMRFPGPGAIPFPADNPYTPEKAALGRKLFFEPLLSADGTLACATCHDPAKGFEDGRRRSRGVPGSDLPRHTPTIWNVAFGEAYFWDGRAGSLEAQARGPIEAPAEMGAKLADLPAKLAAVPGYPQLFRAAFPEQDGPSEAAILAALATFERTLVSPPTRFDAWVAGDEAALTAEEKVGFALFTGKAGCANCHDGWAFTDHAFYDIGLPGDDRGRGKELGLAPADHAFKTPTLREIGRRAPYMHDGSLPDLEAVLDHYERGVVARPTLASDLPRLYLEPDERRDLLAFLRTLDSAEPTWPRLPSDPSAVPAGETASVMQVSQRDKRFTPERTRLAPATRLRIVNDDTRTHNVRIHDPRLMLDTGAQEPGQAVTIGFPSDGRYTVFCGIHPKMKLVVEVGAADPALAVSAVRGGPGGDMPAAAGDRPIGE